MADIRIEDLTTLDLQGTGVFDVLMQAVNLHIDDQFNKDRLTGTDYATVYLGSMQAVIAQSMQFLLNEKLQEAQIDNLIAENLIKAKQLEIAEKELELKAKEALMAEAKMRDENGFASNGAGGIDPYNEAHTVHFNQVGMIKAQKATEEEKDDLIKAQTEAAKTDIAEKEGRLIQDLNGAKDPVAGTWTFNRATVTNGEVEWDAGGITSPYHVNLRRLVEESKIAESTAKGYRADGAYKAYKSLQELFFALANVGVEAGDTDVNEYNNKNSANPYAKIMASMETLINKHMKEWYETMPDIELTNTYTPPPQG